MIAQAKRIYINQQVALEIEDMFSVFLSSYRNTCGSLREQEMLWEQEPQVPQEPRVFPKLFRDRFGIETIGDVD